MIVNLNHLYSMKLIFYMDNLYYETLKIISLGLRVRTTKKKCRNGVWGGADLGSEMLVVSLFL